MARRREARRRSGGVVRADLALSVGQVPDALGQVLDALLDLLDASLEALDGLGVTGGLGLREAVLQAGEALVRVLERLLRVLEAVGDPLAGVGGGAGGRRALGPGAARAGVTGGQRGAGRAHADADGEQGGDEESTDLHEGFLH